MHLQLEVPLMRTLPFMSTFAAALCAICTPVCAKTMAEVLAASKPADWRRLDPANTLYMELDSGRVVIELAPQFAPQLIGNLTILAREKYFDGSAIMRAQDNFVVQWGGADEAQPRTLGTAKRKVPAEFDRGGSGLDFIALPDPDTYAPQTGFIGGFPAARDPKSNRAWLIHCYGTVGAGRDNAADSGNGSELYAVIGHAPRQLDRNVTVIGRVVQGMELLSVMPRGKGDLGFYQKPQERTPIRSLRLAADVPQEQRSQIEILRTDTQTFTDLIEARRNRKDDWYKVQAGRIDVCNVPLPARQIGKR
jgi:peptidylprolyl isomerase